MTRFVAKVIEIGARKMHFKSKKELFKSRYNRIKEEKAP